MSNIVQSLWIGPELSTLERVSISSFLRHGHEYHLYVFDQVMGIPTGTVVKDGNEILPSSMVFQYKVHRSYAAFSNFFRYKLLLDRGGWWVDTDVVCIGPFRFSNDHVFSTEMALGRETITSGIIKAPVDSPVMSYAWSVCQTKDPSALVWGEVGPRLIAEAVGKFSLERFAKPHDVFCPLSYTDWRRVLDPFSPPVFGKSTCAIHLWNEMWRRSGADKNGSYHPDSLYENLKRQFLC